MEDLRAWLTSVDLGRYADAFEANDVDLEVLGDLSDEDLAALGLSLGHRRKLQKALRAMSEADPSTVDQSAPGEPTAATGGRGPRAEAERRQLTVMFCDLAGSTELSQNLDAEEMHEVNRAYQDACKAAIERYDGYVARYMGDGVLAYFGYPQAHEDDAERAIHAGLGVVDAVAALDPTVGARSALTLEVRVGIATGPVVVGDIIGEGASQESAVVGETPNLAARLQALAAPNAVVVSPRTRALVAGQFEYEDLGLHVLKGIASAVHVWRAASPSRAESRFEAAHRAELTPLVGRKQEVELLMERWERAKEGDGQIVLLSGEAGVGKSRIIASLRERTGPDEPVRLRYQCSPYHSSSALHPIIEQLERAARFAAEDTDDERLDKLESLLSAGTREVEAVAARLAPLLSISSAGRYPPLEMSPERQKAQTLEALVAQLDGLSRSHPVLFLFEDAHWADPTSLELLELTVSRVQTLPVLVVITFRAEFRPPWTRHTHVTSLTLNRLTRNLAADLVNRITGGKALPDRVVEDIIEKTDGVPLFVEELTKTILESGLVREDADRYLLSGSLSELAIPATLHDSLMARLDRLGTVKEVAQTASVIGREFDYDLLAAVSPLGFSDLRDALAQLVDAELVFRRGNGHEDRYIFKHGLVRDAAYESLLNRKRREIHGRIAEVMESRFRERVEREPELLAGHFTEADLPERAVPYWRDAGRLASSRSAYAEAAHHFARGLDDLAGVDTESGALGPRLELQVGLADSLAWSKGFTDPEVEVAYSRARELCREMGDAPQNFGILWGLWHYFDLSGNLDRAHDLARELSGIAATNGSPGQRSQAHRALGETLFFRGELAQARTELELGAAAYVPGDDGLVRGGENPAVSNRALCSAALWCLGYPDQALRRATEALEHSHRTGNAGDRAIAGVFMGWVHLLRREPERARDHSEQLLEFSAERGMVFFEVFATVHRGAALAPLGLAEEGRVEIAGAVDVSDGIGARTVGVWFATLLAEAHQRGGAPGDALAVLERAYQAVEDTGCAWLQAELHRLEAAARLRTGRAPEAEACLERAIDVARRQQARSFELRASTDLAHLWRGQGRGEQARALLSPVLAWFTEGFDTPDLVAAKGLLDELGPGG